MAAEQHEVGDPGGHPLDPSRFREAMSRLASGVTIVTTEDEHGEPHGFTASSFCSVSLDPPLVLVCLAWAATCYPVFAATGRFDVSILKAHHAGLAQRFASKVPGKFGQGRFVRTASGRTALDDASAVIQCSVDARHPAGDHVLIVGRVDEVLLAGKESPAVYFDRSFGTFCP